MAHGPTSLNSERNPHVRRTALSLCLLTLLVAPLARTQSTAAAPAPDTVMTPPVQKTVTVTAFRTPLGDLESPASTRLLTEQDIKYAAPVTLDGKLRQVPGLETFRRSSSLVANPSSQGLSLRGLGSTSASRTLVTAGRHPTQRCLRRLDPLGRTTRALDPLRRSRARRRQRSLRLLSHRWRRQYPSGAPHRKPLRTQIQLCGASARTRTTASSKATTVLGERSPQAAFSAPTATSSPHQPSAGSSISPQTSTHRTAWSSSTTSSATCVSSPA